MTTCRDCIYVEACYALNREIAQHPKDFLETDLCAKQCKTFKARADYLDASRVLYIMDKLAETSKPLSSTFYNIFHKLKRHFMEKCIITSVTDSELRKGRGDV